MAWRTVDIVELLPALQILIGDFEWKACYQTPQHQLIANIMRAYIACIAPLICPKMRAVNSMSRQRTHGGSIRKHLRRAIVIGFGLIPHILVTSGEKPKRHRRQRQPAHLSPLNRTHFSTSDTSCAPKPRRNSSVPSRSNMPSSASMQRKKRSEVARSNRGALKIG